ncbi:MAG: hypothetical protein DWQ05_21790 [Calditrichaeota bacterium]|nr:MAG: hypothetical protein DWQ05_21790 [Calditrichota bacterium]
MQKLLTLLITISFIGCAASKQETPRVKTTKSNKTYIKVMNTLDTSIHVHLKKPKQKPIYLGRVFSHEKKNFQVKGPFKSSSFKLIAKPIIGQTRTTTLKAPKSPGKLLAWNVGKKRSYNNVSE